MDVSGISSKSYYDQRPFNAGEDDSKSQQATIGQSGSQRYESPAEITRAGVSTAAHLASTTIQPLAVQAAEVRSSPRIKSAAAITGPVANEFRWG